MIVTMPRDFYMPVNAILRACDNANIKYEDNLEVIGPEWIRGNQYRVRLTVKSSRAFGGRRSWDDSRYVHAACWHAYRDFLYELFVIAPTAHVHANRVFYKGIVSFFDLYRATGERNIGSMFAPMPYQYACDCVDNHNYALEAQSLSVSELKERIAGDWQ